MLLSPLRHLVETANRAPGHQATGTFRPAEWLFDHERLAALDHGFAGVYVMLLFDTVVDTGLARYLATACANDSGREIYVLYPVATQHSGPVSISPERLAELLLPDDELATFVASALALKRPMMRPAALVLRRIATQSEPILVDLNTMGNITDAAVAMRELLRAIKTVAVAGDETHAFAKALSIELIKKGFSYQSNAPITATELVIKMYPILVPLKGQLATVARFGAKALM